MQDLRLQLFKSRNQKKMLNPFEPVGTVLSVFSNNNYHKFWENFNLPVVRGSETQTKRKECSISCIAIADVINDQAEAMVF